MAKGEKMSATCPPECQKELGFINKKIKGHDSTLYGEHGDAGLIMVKPELKEMLSATEKNIETTMKDLKVCMNKYLTKRFAWISFALFATIIGSFIIYAMGSFAAEKERRADLTTKVEIHERSVVRLEKNQAELKETQETIQDDIAEIKRQLKEIKATQISVPEVETAVKKAMREVIGQPQK